MTHAEAQRRREESEARRIVIVWGLALRAGLSSSSLRLRVSARVASDPVSAQGRTSSTSDRNSSRCCRATTVTEYDPSTFFLADRVM